MKRLSLATTILLSVLVYLAVCLPASAGNAVINLSQKSGNDFDVQVNSSGKAVWRGWDGTDWEIYSNSPGSSAVNLSNNSYDDFSPQLTDGGDIVWRGWDGHDYEIYLLLPGTVTPLNYSENPVDDQSPQISSGNADIVWRGWDGNDYEIYLKSYGSDTVKLTNNSNDDDNPRISSDGQVVWQGHDGNDWEIYRYISGLGTTNLSNDAYHDYEPQINNNGQVVWRGLDPGSTDNEIFFYQTSLGKINLSNNTADDWLPQINDSAQVVWEQGGGTTRQIYTRAPFGSAANISDNALENTTPQINSSGQIAWSGGTTLGAEEEIFLYTPGAGVATLTGNSFEEEAVQINDNGQVAWQGGAAAEIYMYTSTTDYFFTWYDNLGGDNWVLMANNKSSGSLGFNLSIGWNPMNLAGFNNGIVGARQIITPSFTGLRDGPVKVESISGEKGIVSQRTLWPKGGKSLEEVTGTEAEKLSSHFYWTWYDGTNGFKNWVLVSNPHAYRVGYRIKLGGAEIDTGEIPGGQSITPIFPGSIGGPLEVEAWRPAPPFNPETVMASQRVLSNGDKAFNEVPGIPESDLSSDYVWTWYDNHNPGAHNWVMIANPGINANSMHYEIWIGGIKVKDDSTGGGTTIPVNGYIFATFSPPDVDAATGPVRVKTFLDSGHTVPMNSIASQRVIWGPSFEEVPGYPYAALTNTYHWTWYDQSPSNVYNWVMVSKQNFASDTVYYKVLVGGVQRQSCTQIPASGRDFPAFAGLVGGPVEVRSYSNASCTTPSAPGNGIMASQRVLWKGYFNEVMGTVLN